MPRTATVGHVGTTLPSPSSLPQGAHVTIHKNGGKTMTTKGGKRRRGRSTKRHTRR